MTEMLGLWAILNDSVSKCYASSLQFLIPDFPLLVPAPFLSSAPLHVMTLLWHVLSLQHILLLSNKTQNNACTFCHQRGGDKLCRHCNFFFSLKYWYMWYCVCHLCVCAHMCVAWGGVTCVHTGTSAHKHVHGCVLTIRQMATADAEILSTQCFQALFFLKEIM